MFILLGVHGKLVGNPKCEMPQSHNHIPLIFHGADIEPQTVDCYCGQIDVAPTLLDMLNVEYVQNNFGINLEKEKRPYIFYTNDKFIATRDSSRLFIYEPSESLRSYYDLSGGGVSAVERDTVFEDMEKYCFSMFQSAQFTARERLTVNFSAK